MIMSIKFTIFVLLTKLLLLIAVGAIANDVSAEKGGDDKMISLPDPNTSVGVAFGDDEKDNRSIHDRQLGILLDLIQGWLYSRKPAPARPPAKTNDSNKSLPSTANFAPIRINCGGKSFTDSKGHRWMADTYHNNEGAATFDFLNTILRKTPDAEVFQSFRISNRLLNGAMEYHIPLPEGRYKVSLYFAELFFLAPNARIFNVWMEDSLTFSSAEIVPGGRPEKVIELRTVTEVRDGRLDIVFQAINRNAFLSAIMISGVANDVTSAPVVSPLSVPVSPPKYIPTKAPHGTTMAPVTKSKSPKNEATEAPLAAPTTMEPMPSSKNEATEAPLAAPTTMEPMPPTKNEATEAPLAAPTTMEPMPPTKNENSKAPLAAPTTKEPLLPSKKEATEAPFTAPTTKEPVPSPPHQNPTISPVDETPDIFKTIFINSGGDAFRDYLGQEWVADTYYVGGSTYSDARYYIVGTQDDYIFQTERFGVFQYEVPVPAGNYEIILYFAELYHSSEASRLFNIDIEGKSVFTNVDIVKLGEGQNYRALSLGSPALVEDGFLSLSFTDSVPKVDNPKVSGIIIKLLKDHLAHAVTGGPYFAVDTDGSGFADIPVDAGYSHTHGKGLVLVNFIWRMGSTILKEGADAEVTTLRIPVGDNMVSLTVIDSGGNDSTEETTITVLSSDFPDVKFVSPDAGSITGGLQVSIHGSGFNYPSSETTVIFGLNVLTGPNITVVNKNLIKVNSPRVHIGSPVDISVETPKGRSSAQKFTYVASSPIEFDSGKIENFPEATSVAFGPDRRLYVGTLNGYMYKISFVDGSFNISSWVVAKVSIYRAILGMAFDPLDTADHPCVYFGHSFFFHGEWKSTSGEAINGKVSKVCGANLDNLVDIVTGLPVSDHDHGINAIEFGDFGELYIQIGSNTNMGIPGQLSGTQLQKENVLSAATLVANISDPAFDGTIKYNKDDDGDHISGFGVKVFAAGERNPFGLVLHSNGNMYGTDNGPNLSYGKRSLGCDGSFGIDTEEEDKLILIESGNYYGHANLKRGINDPRQCVWRSSLEPSDSQYTAPMMSIQSSMDGIIEWQSAHFDGQLRGDLMISKYNGGIYRVLLSDDGRSVAPESNPALLLVEGKGLDLTQAPSGELLECRFQSNEVWYHRPMEAENTSLVVHSVFPRRGGQAGGSILHIFGRNFVKNGEMPQVSVGESNCPVLLAKTLAKYDRIECTIPGGNGTVDIIVTIPSTGEKSVFRQGYRYITGLPK